ncbi:DUF4198 domain-containing protein [Paraglaciecola aquimarina]|uniref:DUF4198 domain-containing protein n=1 Tax=Paraglaciecola aquimarina TaxID=1235557 RepID=A0ABU3T097_9ALTE|nr:DUF4198 domain-containing protein [Paraglaciecola aquimarina]MDU0355671.1 DUF4198 domain-containing protein [Paraglaciecola aquimarina]
MRLNKLLSAVLLATACTTAYAHTPYLAPATFEQSRADRVTLDAAFAEAFFVPEAAFNNSIFTVLTPEGKTLNPDNIAKLQLRTVVEHQLTEDGTYRFSTGKRLGRVFKMYELDGKRKALENPADPVPEGGKLVSFFQSLTYRQKHTSLKVRQTKQH